MSAAPAEFAIPDFAAPLDLDAHQALVPAKASTRGMFFTALQQEGARAGVALAGGPWVAFKSYPLTEYNQLAVDAARAVHPDVPLREGLRRIGRLSYPTFADSLIGRVLFGVLGKDIQAITRVAGKAYELAGTPGTATVIDMGEKYSHVRIEDVWAFVDCLQVGVFEGAFHAVDLQGRVFIRRLSPCAAELFSVWE